MSKRDYCHLVFRRCIVLFTLALFGAIHASANDSAIRKNLADRLPNLPAIDEISKTSMPGLYELRAGSDVFYSDENGDLLFRGQLIDTRTKTNITEERLAELSSIDFASLPLKDAIVWKQGSGARKIVVFADPNCGYCKHFEQQLQVVKDITVYTFLYPILGADSMQKSRDILCAKDKEVAWTKWMRLGQMPKPIQGACDYSVIQRNIMLGKKHRIDGTPGIVFEDGKVVAGALEQDELEKHLRLVKEKLQ